MHHFCSITLVANICLISQSVITHICSMDWVPSQRGFKKHCPVCGEQFIGRKNRLYCGSACKARTNNDLASERREEHLAVSSSLIKNSEILKEVMFFHTGDSAIVPIEALMSKGFDPEAPARRVQMMGGVWVQYGDYAIQAIEGHNQVRITKLK